MKSKLLAKYIANECTPEEQEMVSVWLAEDATHRQLLKEYKEIWDVSSEFKRTEDFDVELDWAVLQSRMESEHNERTFKVHKSKNIFSLYSNWSVFARVAAIVLIAVTIGVYTNQKYINEVPEVKPILREISMSRGQRGSLTLSDGTKVLINSDSKITLPPVFKSDIREVYLEGEAFFEVAKNPNKPFVIHTRGAIVQVLGTSFAIKSFPEDEEVQMVVEEGVVSFRAEKQSIDEGVILTAGKVGHLDLEEKTIVTEDAKDLDAYLSWREGYLTFQNTSMKEVKKQLERKYDIEVSFTSESINQLQLTAELKSRSLTYVLETISMSLGLKYKFDQDKVSFSLNSDE